LPSIHLHRLVRVSNEWAAIVSSAEDNRESYCNAPCGKPLYSALYGTYTVTLHKLKNVLKASSQAGQTKQADGFKEVTSRKRHSTGEAARTPKKTIVTTPALKVATSNFFAPLRTAHMDTDAPPPTQSQVQLRRGSSCSSKEIGPAAPQ
jgi:hypothetical protein